MAWFSCSDVHKAGPSSELADLATRGIALHGNGAEEHAPPVAVSLSFTSTMTMSSPKLEVQSLVDALYVAVRNRVLAGELVGGEPVTEKNLSTQYDVARPTAKAVIERLTHEGLLVRGAHKTARVRIMAVDDIRDLYYSRGFLEREAVQALARERNVPAQALAAIDEMKDALSQHSVMDVVTTDIAFHRALLETLGSRRVMRMYLSLMGEVQLCMAQVQTNRLLRAAVILDEHNGILEAVAEGDDERAAQNMSAHLNRACNELTTHLATGGDPK